MLDAGVAVLDFGCPFLHEHFGTPAGTRIHALWDQGSPLGSPLTSQPSNSWPWDVPPGFMQGRELQPDMLDAINLAVRRKGGPEESLAYRGIDHLIDYDDPRRRLWRATHGGHVFDMAGGSVDPVTGEGDHAAMAPLIFVQLPSLTAMDSAGGSLAAQLLDGVRYAMSLVASGKPLVVVISYGNCAGPHDGTSLIESALDELLEQRQNNFAIVLAAGNSRRDQGHARRAVAKDRSALLRLQLAPGDTTDTFVEAWYPRSGAPLQVRMRGPDRVWSAWIGQAEEQLLRAGTTDQEVVAMIRHDRFAPNGDGAQVLLAFAPTTEPAGIECRLCEAGVWEIEFRLADPKGTSVELHAWVERDDPAPHTSSPHTHFIDQLIDDEFETTSSIANGTHTIKAFGFNAQSRRPAPYSALPSNARLCVGTEALQVMAACEEDEVNRDFAAAATRSEETYRMRGTSVAAPVLARRLFNAMVDLEGNETMERGDWVSLLDYLVAAHSGDPAVQELRKE